MYDIISDLYYGNIQPYDKSYKEGSRTAELIQVVSESEDWLTEHLEGKAKGKLLNLLNAQSELNATAAYEGFCDGFLLGAKLIMEICCSPEEEGDD